MAQYYLGNTQLNQFWLGNTEIGNVKLGYYIPPGNPLIYVNPNAAPVDSSVINFGSGAQGTLGGDISYNSTGIKSYTLGSTQDGHLVFADEGDPLNNVTIAIWQNCASTGFGVSKWDLNDLANDRAIAFRRYIELTPPQVSYEFFASRDGTNTDWVRDTPHVDINLNEWYFNVYQYNGDTGLFNYNFSYTSSYSDVASGSFGWDLGGSGSLHDSNRSWSIGGIFDSFYNNYAFAMSGSFGHTFIYNDYLSSNDLETIYNNTKEYYGY